MTRRLIAQCNLPPTRPAPGSALDRLIASLDGVGSIVPVSELRTLIERTPLGLDDVRDYLRINAATYARNRVARTDRFEVLVFCWCPGQRSSIHDHQGSACGVRVICGTATETIFERVPGSEHVRPIRVGHPQSGQVTASYDADIHEIASDDPGGVLLVTLHVYSPPLDEMNVYQATNAPMKGAAA